MEQPADLKRLVEEARRESYDPRAERCWPWSHRWTMWQPYRSVYPVAFDQRRRCLRCGLMQEKRIR